MGADFIRRRRRDHDAADRLSRQSIWRQTAVPGLRHRFHGRLDAVRPGGFAGSDRLFRLVQGAFGAALVPLSQAVLLNTFPKERQGSAMAYWGMAIMVGPIIGPILGGWLTYNYSWRWDFYINVPIGILAFLGMCIFLPGTRRTNDKLDWFGFAILSVAIGALQILLDRGEELDWFGSREIQIEAVVSASAFYLFLVHTLTARAPFVNPKLFYDRSFAAGMLTVFLVGVTFFAPLALLPLYLQDLMGYPVITAGLVTDDRHPRRVPAAAAFP